MGDPVKFKAVKDRVIEVGTDREVAFGSNVEKIAAHLNAEHADGRVAQAHCVIGSTRGPDGMRSGGHACDYDRVNDARLLTDAQRGALVLCDDHADVVDAARLTAREAAS